MADLFSDGDGADSLAEALKSSGADMPAGVAGEANRVQAGTIQSGGSHTSSSQATQYFHPGAHTPLAVRMRPRSLDEVVGQEKVLAGSTPLRRLIEGKGETSVILYGPPGTGKTTIASLIAGAAGRHFVALSALNSGVKEVRAVIEEARQRLEQGGSTVLFIDEVHRFSKTQQDALLSAVENRTVLLVAATTENPSFAVVAPLLSRSLLVLLEPLGDKDIRELALRAVADERGFGGAFTIEEEALDFLVALSAGDARRALTYLEAAADSVAGESSAQDNKDNTARDNAAQDNTAQEDSADTDSSADADISSGENSAQGDTAQGDTAQGDAAQEDTEQKSPTDTANADSADTSAQHSTPRAISVEDIRRSINQAVVRYDRDGDQHYDVISAFIKSIRGSDPDAALHYLARMIEAGEDPRFITRRLVIHASEDIGMADPTAIQVAMAAHQAVSFIGLPEARLTMAQATIHLATAPKSNAVIEAINQAQADVRRGKGTTVPAHLRDGHYQGAEALGNAVGYVYPHNDPRGVSPQQYLPDDLRDARYYAPSTHGHEQVIAGRLEALRKIVHSER